MSSRIGATKTLVTGLAILVVFSALAGLSGSIDGIVGFRAGWRLGNALFIATSLAVIVAAATGGFAGALVLYEAALGLGIAAARWSAACSVTSAGAARSPASRPSWRSRCSPPWSCSTTSWSPRGRPPCRRRWRRCRTAAR